MLGCRMWGLCYGAGCGVYVRVQDVGFMLGGMVLGAGVKSVQDD